MREKPSERKFLTNVLIRSSAVVLVDLITESFEIYTESYNNRHDDILYKT